MAAGSGVGTHQGCGPFPFVPRLRLLVSGSFSGALVSVVPILVCWCCRWAPRGEPGGVVAPVVDVVGVVPVNNMGGWPVVDIAGAVPIDDVGGLSSMSLVLGPSMTWPVGEVVPRCQRPSSPWSLSSETPQWRPHPSTRGGASWDRQRGRWWWWEWW